MTRRSRAAKRTPARATKKRGVIRFYPNDPDATVGLQEVAFAAGGEAGFPSIQGSTRKFLPFASV